MVERAESKREPIYSIDGERELTIRAVLTGMLLGGALSLCNIYSGLKIGWAFNMSITSALLAFAFWRTFQSIGQCREFGVLENNINQTAASAAASISSAGLVAPIPALTILTGQTLGWGSLALWTYSVCLVGIVVAIGLRRQMVEVEKLPFPSGIANAETLREIHSRGREAMQRVRVLLTGAVVATGVKLVETLAHLPKFAPSWKIHVQSGGLLEKSGTTSITLTNLTLSFDPSLLMVAVGSLSGLRVGVSMLLGSFLAYGIIGPIVLEKGWVVIGNSGPDVSWYGTLIGWLLWPGVGLMVTAALTSFAFSGRVLWETLRCPPTGAPAREGEGLPRWFLNVLGLAFILSVVLQFILFAVPIWIAGLGVLFTFLMAAVAARVSGETNITPVGAMGKVTQLLFGVIAPGQPAANLMAANVTGGAASQCADLMHDLKCGSLLGANPHRQALAQFAGALAGALAGSAGYLILIPDPTRQLLTDQWPAPAAAAWKAVAEIFMKGLGSMPPGSVEAMLGAGILGIVLAVLEKKAPPSWRIYVPSPAALGIAFAIPGYNSISMFLGSAAGLLVSRWFTSWATKFLVVLASGIIAGESITGVGLALERIFSGG